jgi:uncharacterized sulfatase
MRSIASMPSFMKMYPQYLREAGYYCTNKSKEDYNLRKPGKVWDESSRRAHWKNRAAGQPFFAIFNHTMTHESQIRKRPHTPVHDPKKVPIPAYHPDTPEVRLDWAQYHDKITEMDKVAGQNLRELEEAGLADDTIVFFYGDHGAGMPRGKRWPFSSGLRVPMIVYVPEKYRDLAPDEYAVGGKSKRLVGFVDLAPTVLSIAGIRPPEYMQGHAFMGAFETAPPEYMHGFRGRMDERVDMVRTTRDARYIYIRNYMPHRIYGQHVAYMFQTPTTQVWKQLYDEGKLQPPRTFFWERKPPEELYDLEQDPDEVRNLAGDPKHRDVLERMRKAQRELIFEIRDVGFLPEGEIHERAEGTTPYQMGHDPKRYPLEKIFRAAQIASSLDPEALPGLKECLQDKDSAVRYWGAMGILMRGKGAVAESKAALHRALEDSSPYVRVPAAEALGTYGNAEDLEKALAVLGKDADPSKSGPFASVSALIAVDELGDKAAPLIEGIRSMPNVDSRAEGRVRGYSGRLVQTILSRAKR